MCRCSQRGHRAKAILTWEPLSVTAVEEEERQDFGSVSLSLCLCVAQTKSTVHNSITLREIVVTLNRRFHLCFLLFTALYIFVLHAYCSD